VGIDKYKESIKKTGFFLEFKVANSLKENGWSIISNRYYIDDLTETVREIDIVGYKTRKVKDFNIFTVLLISCKKNEKNLWALLAKKIKLYDLNVEWRPMHVWSNHRVMAYMLEKTEWKDRYFKTAERNGVQQAMNAPEVDIFAFQEMNIKSGSVQNDKAIFDSVTSLMKAQAYELSSLPSRKKNKVVYQFNLISVIDSDLVRLYFEKDNIEVMPIDQDIYISNYIIQKEPTCVRIHFVRSSTFSSVLDDYANLHKSNCQFFKKIYDDFFASAMEDWWKRQVFEKDFSDRITWKVKAKLRRLGIDSKEVKDISLGWHKKKGILSIYAGLSEEQAEYLNSDKVILEDVAGVLEEIYHYRGNFRFYIGNFSFEDGDDVPF